MLPIKPFAVGSGRTGISEQRALFRLAFVIPDYLASAKGGAKPARAEGGAKPIRAKGSAQTARAKSGARQIRLAPKLARAEAGSQPVRPERSEGFDLLPIKPFAVGSGRTGNGG